MIFYDYVYTAPNKRLKSRYTIWMIESGTNVIDKL